MAFRVLMVDKAEIFNAVVRGEEPSICTQLIAEKVKENLEYAAKALGTKLEVVDADLGLSLLNEGDIAIIGGHDANDRLVELVEDAAQAGNKIVVSSVISMNWQNGYLSVEAFAGAAKRGKVEVVVAENTPAVEHHQQAFRTYIDALAKNEGNFKPTAINEIPFDSTVS